MEKIEKQNQRLQDIILRQTRVIIALSAVILLMPLIYVNRDKIEHVYEFLNRKRVETHYTPVVSLDEQEGFWIPSDIYTVKDADKLAQLKYGKDLIAHTSKYFGPKGSVAQLSNGLNCQNCHLAGGTKVYGNNYGSVASLYPKLRSRSGTVEDIPKRVNDCFERSMNGSAIPEDGKEMQAIVAYMKFIGSNVPKGEKAQGSGLQPIAFLDRAADPVKGKPLYDAKCASCHMADGSGQMNLSGNEYIYPPLWGEHSFNDAAGLYRVSNMAKYIKVNMPFGADHRNTQLSDEDSWDIAAFLSSQPRPHKSFTGDYPDLTKKPIDAPYGPYADNFSEKQHKYGPYTEMKK